MSVVESKITCQSCECNFIIQYNTLYEVLYCPFCGSTVLDEEEFDADQYDEWIEGIEDEWS